MGIKWHSISESSWRVVSSEISCTGLCKDIFGKLRHSEELGNLVNWASEYLNDRRSISYMIDSSLQSFKDSELDVICEVIQGCIQPEPKLRPTMKDITSKLREVVNV
ncbi:protein MALE DISCOVERER 2-like [Vicia villosa]|uniref:protein MALE DISCOVERER 2-like n=1 Tax=Vicia villosa TaxID=3911 RepID=UPI00273C229E|nr:protein MALE DISCOVERER 2-like [Vicia villosa]